MDDPEVQETVETILGKNVKVIDCEKKSTIREEEVLLINGLPVTLEGRDGRAIKQALLTGQVPPCDLLNTLLIKTGILKAPVKLETSLSVKTSTITKEEVTVARGGKIVDERSREVKENNIYTSSSSEIWEPVKIIPTADLPKYTKNTEIPFVNNQTHWEGKNGTTYDPRAETSHQNYRQVPKNNYSEGFGPPNIQNGVNNLYYKQENFNPNQKFHGSNGHYAKNGSPIVRNGPPLVRNDPNNIKNGPQMRNDPNMIYRNDPTLRNEHRSDQNNIRHDPNHINSIRNDPSNMRNDPNNTVPLRSDPNIPDMNYIKNMEYWDRNKFSDGSQTGYETGSERKFGSCSSASSNESDLTGLNRFPSKDSGHLTNSSSVGITESSGESLNSLDETDFKNDLIYNFRKCGLKTNGYKKDISDPTIFGTVASDLIPKDCSNRRSLPQTPQTSKNFSSLYNGDSLQNTDNIAASEIHHDNALVYRDGNLISGPLEALIQHTVPTDTYYPDRAYLFAFLLSSRLFVRPHELLARIRALGDQQQAGQRPGSGKFAEYMVQLITEWTETFPYDFRDERVMQHIRALTHQYTSFNPSLSPLVQTVLSNLHQRLTSLEAYEKAYDHLCDDQTSTDILETCPSALVLAQQLTHVELERLSFIGPEEFVQAFAKENPNVETSYKDMKKTRNLEQYVQWFNRLSYFVATQVCKHPKKKQRVRVVEYWIETARECFNIGNFNSLMAIIAGLNMSPISRLKKTWHKIQSGKFSILEHQMDPSSNFSSYRSTLKAAMWRSAGATDQRQRIVIPFFSLLVKDLYFLNEGCSNRLPNGHINFEKFWQLAKQVTEFMAWKQVTCPFEKDLKVISVLQRSPVLGENALALASFECEPPENNQERERCKSLKAESNNTS